MSSTTPVTMYPSIKEEFGWTVECWRGSPQYARFLAGSSAELIRSPAIVSNGGFRWRWEILLRKREAEKKSVDEKLEESKTKPKDVVENEVMFRCVSEKWLHVMSVLRMEGSWIVKNNKKKKSDVSRQSNETIGTLPIAKSARQTGVSTGYATNAVISVKVDSSMSPGDAFESSVVKISSVSDALDFTANFTISGWEATTTPSPCSEEEPPSLALLEEFHDLTVEAGGQQFVAHKAVLASRSRVLRSMLKTDMKEEQENRIVMTDVSAPAWRQFQNFLYSNRTSFPSDWDFSFLMEMLILSDKYELASLKKLTEEVIVSRLNRENVFEILREAEKFNLPRVAETASNIILKNWDAMKSDEKFTTFISFGSDVAMTLLLKLKPDQS